MESQKVGTHTHEFSLLTVASYTIRMSVSPLGTSEYLISNFNQMSVVNMYCRFSTFSNLDRTFTLCSGSAGLNYIHPPYLIVFISDGWPSSLIALLGLKLPVASGFFPSPYHCYFKSSTAVSWHHPPLDFAPSAIVRCVVFIISGTLEFVKTIWPQLGENVDHTFVSIEFAWSGLS